MVWLSALGEIFLIFVKYLAMKSGIAKIEAIGASHEANDKIEHGNLSEQELLDEATILAASQHTIVDE